MPLSHPSVELRLILAVLLLGVLYFASSLVLPFVIAAFLSLFASPLVAQLSRLKLPRSLSAALVILILSLGLVTALSLLSAPAANWLERLPVLSEQLMKEAGQAASTLSELRDDLVPGDEDAEEEKEEDASIQTTLQQSMMALMSTLAQETAVFLLQIATVLVVTYFCLVYGNDLLRRLVRAQPSLGEKKATVLLFEQVRDDVSRYVLTISVINLCLGLAVSLALYLLEVDDPLLWGALAGLLNYAPYIGTLIMAGLLTLVGFTEFQALPEILLVPGTFLLLNFLEAQYITPTILGSRFNLNPLMVVLWMFFWGWMWGAAGVLLAIPMLVSVHIVTAHTGMLSDSWMRIFTPHTADEFTHKSHAKKETASRHPKN